MSIFGTDPRTGQSQIADPFARMLIAQSMADQPINHPLQLAGRLAQLGVGLWRDEKRRSGDEKELADALAKLPGLSQPTIATGPSAPSPSARPEQPMWTAPGIPGVLPGTQAPTAQDAGTWHTRQNNPGNVRQTEASLKAYPGAQPGERGFLAFQSPEQGLAAIAQTFRHIAKTTGQNTLLGILSVYAPKGDGANDPAAYAAAVSKETGIPIDAPLNVNDAATMAKIIPAVVRVETGRASSYTPGQIASATGAPPAASQVAQAPPATATDAPAIPPQTAAYIRRLLQSKNPTLRQLGMQLYGQYSKPEQYEFKTAGEQAYRWNSRTGKAEPILDVPKPPPAGYRYKEGSRTELEAVPGGPAHDPGKLRKEIQDLPSYKNITQAAPVYKSMLEAAGRDNRAADVNLIYGLAKIMDPTSVVRESEMSVAQAVATLPQYLRANIMSQLQATGRLSPDVRSAIMGEAHSRVNAYRGMFDQDISQYRGIVERQRFDPRDVIPEFGEFPAYKAPPRVAKFRFNPATGKIEEVK